MASGVGIASDRKEALVWDGERVGGEGSTHRMFGARTTLPKMRALSAAIFLGVLALMASLPLLLVG